MPKCVGIKDSAVMLTTGERLEGNYGRSWLIHLDLWDWKISKCRLCAAMQLPVFDFRPNSAGESWIRLYRGLRCYTPGARYLLQQMLMSNYIGGRVRDRVMPCIKQQTYMHTPTASVCVGHVRIGICKKERIRELCCFHRPVLSYTYMYISRLLINIIISKTFGLKCQPR